MFTSATKCEINLNETVLTSANHIYTYKSDTLTASPSTLVKLVFVLDFNEKNRGAINGYTDI